MSRIFIFLYHSPLAWRMGILKIPFMKLLRRLKWIKACNICRHVSLIKQISKIVCYWLCVSSQILYAYTSYVLTSTHSFVFSILLNKIMMVGDTAIRAQCSLLHHSLKLWSKLSLSIFSFGFLMKSFSWEESVLIFYHFSIISHCCDRLQGNSKSGVSMCSTGINESRQWCLSDNGGSCLLKLVWILIQTGQ